MSLVSWDMVCTPKSKGGLGFKKLEIMNHALIMKNTWSLIIEPTKLSNQVLLMRFLQVCLLGMVPLCGKQWEIFGRKLEGAFGGTLVMGRQLDFGGIVG